MGKPFVFQNKGPLPSLEAGLNHFRPERYIDIDSVQLEMPNEITLTEFTSASMYLPDLRHSTAYPPFMRGASMERCTLPF